ncbi:alpha/beta fold hydrolase [Prauserella muralis]|uniref:AB hydrolase-1 domain-containing protein n=1 Tax=Prauserella muralis TaxID=588067 RepID=A0A2V4AYF8_9PSEU|nr:alpha/beta hydrolase [Prauserella muralis]PXY26946.1 hypothetical protein BAY60_10615 [Prauserella muralis]TWE23441.1 pimeloyl-ACP methyl ester carboxylesterase [Prauserella muralis]
MSTVISSDGTVIDYDRYGQGHPVIFIGGMTQHRAIDQGTTEIATKLAAEGFTAIDYDRRGRGRSGDMAPWDLRREVEDVAALIDAVGGPATLYTSSSGATVGLAAASEGVGVAALALYEPPLFPGAGHAEDLSALRALIAEGRHDEAVRHTMVHVMGLPEEAVEGMAQDPSWAGMVSVAPTFVYDLSAVHDVGTGPDWRTRWAGVTVPTVVFSGDATFPGMPEAADAVAAALPNATRRVLPGQGHGPAADAIVPALVEFLRP